METRDHTLFDLPLDVTSNLIFSTLEKKDCLALRLSSTQMNRFAAENKVWVNHAKELGIHVNSFKEYLMAYSFQRGLAYAKALAAENLDYCQKAVARQNHFFRRAYELAEQLSSDDSADAALACYIKGYILSIETLSVPKDYKNGIALLEKAANLGNVDAMLLLGLIHMDPQQITNILSFYNDLRCTFPFYIHIHQLDLEALKTACASQSLPSNPETGLDWIHRAIAADSDVAACVIAATFSQRYEIEKIIATLTTAANKESGQHSAYLLGMILMHIPDEDGGDINRGIEYVKRASERKNAEAHYWLGYGFFDQISRNTYGSTEGEYLTPDLVQFSPEQTLGHLEQAAPHHSLAAYSLAKFHQKGEIKIGQYSAPIPMDIETAIKYFKLGYDQSLNKKYAMELANTFLELHNKDEALFFYERAAELGEMEAWHVLAALYLYGNSHLALEVDDVKADKYLSELLPYADQYFRVLQIIENGIDFAFKHDGIDRELNVFQLLKWGSCIAAKDGHLRYQFAQALEILAPEFAEEGKIEVAALMMELAKTSSHGISKPELVEKLIKLAPYIIKTDFLEEHLEFLKIEKTKPKQPGMWG